MSIPVMVGNAVDAISKNGVVMMNVALRGDGTISENPPTTAFGDFLKINGEGIFHTPALENLRRRSLEGERRSPGWKAIRTSRKKTFASPSFAKATKGKRPKRHPLRLCVARPTKHIMIKTLATGGCRSGRSTDHAVGQQGGDSSTCSPAGLTVDLAAAGNRFRYACGRLTHDAPMTHHRKQAT